MINPANSNVDPFLLKIKTMIEISCFMVSLHFRNHLLCPIGVWKSLLFAIALLSVPIPPAAVHVANVSSPYGGPCPDPMIAGHTSRPLCQDSGCLLTPQTGQFVTS